MYEIIINIISGAAPFTITVKQGESIISVTVVGTLGEHTLPVPSAGAYDVFVVDDLNCEVELSNIVLHTTTTTSSSSTTTTSTTEHCDSLRPTGLYQHKIYHDIEYPDSNFLDVQAMSLIDTCNALSSFCLTYGQVVWAQVYQLETMSETPQVGNIAYAGWQPGWTGCDFISDGTFIVATDEFFCGQSVLLIRVVSHYIVETMVCNVSIT